MKRATRIERLVDYYEDFAPDYVSTWKDIQHYEKPVRAFLREAVADGGRVLDAGCGPGHLTRDLPPSVEVVGFDIAEGMLEIARKKRPHGAYHRHDYHLPIPRSWGRFDVALALGTLEFCDDLCARPQEPRRRDAARRPPAGEHRRAQAATSGCTSAPRARSPTPSCPA